MPRQKTLPAKSITQIAEDVALYPPDAYNFVQEGLAFAVQTVHGQLSDPDVSRHISGQQLSEALRQYALQRWGMLARTVLENWNITCTYDFGKIVFAMVDNGVMQKTDDDEIEDFKNVFDFRRGFDADYHIDLK